MNKTVHVIPSGKGRTVRRPGGGNTGAFFATQKDAVAEARLIVRSSGSGQLVIHGRNGLLGASEVHGLPKIQKSTVKSSLGSKNIQRAVSKIVQERLASA